MQGASYVVDSSSISEENVSQRKVKRKPIVLDVDNKGRLQAREMHSILGRVNLSRAAAGFGSEPSIIRKPGGVVVGLGNNLENPNTKKIAYDVGIPKNMIVHSSLNASSHPYVHINSKRVNDFTPPSLPGGYSKSIAYSRHYHIPQSNHHHHHHK